MPIYEDHLKHWGFKKGEESKDHKYYAREETSGNKNKYRYFYTKAAYDAFKNAWKSGAKTISNTAKKVTSSYTSSYKSGLKQLGTTGKSFIDNYRVGLGIKKKSNIHYDKPIGPGLQVKASGPVIDYAAKNVPERVKKVVKYIAKVKLSNGKTRYFYDQKQYDRWIEVHNYQEKEPKFLEELPEIEPTFAGHMPTRMDDAASVNKNGNSDGDPNRYVNCIYCSLTQEYRRRGYDVESKSIESHSSFRDLSEWFDGLDIQTKDEYRDDSDILLARAYDPDEKPLKIFKFFKTSIVNTDQVKSIDCLSPIKNYNKSFGKLPDISQKGELIERQVLKRMSEFPKGSRGFVSMYWTGGSGHSISFEKDTDGNIHFIDTQYGEEINFKEYAQDFSLYNNVVLTRVDNLQLKKESMDYVQPIK